LAKTNCVFSLANAIEFLKFGLVNALAEEAVSLIHGCLPEKQENLKYLCVPGPENKSQWP
jgi:hypothetical protein